MNQKLTMVLNNEDIKEEKKYGGPYIFYSEINETTCFNVSKRFGTYDDPEVEVYVEHAIYGGFATLRVVIPSMKVLQRKNLDDDLFTKFMQYIQTNSLDMFDVAEGGTKSCQQIP